MDCMGSGRERVKYMFGAMFKGATFFDIFLWNVALAAVWCVVAFIACIKLPSTFFDFEKKRYQATAGGTKITCISSSGKTACPSILPKMVFPKPI